MAEGGRGDEHRNSARKQSGRNSSFCWHSARTRGESGQNVDQKVRRRISRIFGGACAFVMLSLAGVWVFTEYINHGGWPTGATLGAGGDGVWNLWIIYPMIAGALLLGLHWCMTYVTRPYRH
jgi:hypothetical protein